MNDDHAKHANYTAAGLTIAGLAPMLVAIVYFLLFPPHPNACVCAKACCAAHEAD